MTNHTKNNDNANFDNFSGCLLRIFWMMIGNIFVFLCAVAIVQSSTGFFSTADAFYWAFVASLAAARYVDIRYYHGATAEGNPATLADWRRYTLRLVAVAGVGWLAIHAAGYFWFSK